MSNNRSMKPMPPSVHDDHDQESVTHDAGYLVSSQLSPETRHRAGLRSAEGPEVLTAPLDLLVIRRAVVEVLFRVLCAEKHLPHLWRVLLGHLQCEQG